MAKHKVKISKSRKVYIRREKAKIRKEALAKEEQRERFANLYEG